MDVASEPIDIIWKNMGGTRRGVFIFRRLFLHLITIIVILFISTPTAMLSTIKEADFLGIMDFEWLDSLPLGQFMK